MAKAFYLGAYSKYLSNTQFILTHTDKVLPYVAQPLNILFYMTVKKPRVWLYLIDNMIRNNPKGYNALMNLIVDEEEISWQDLQITMKIKNENY